MISGAQTKKPLTHTHTYDNENNVNLHATREGCERAGIFYFTRRHLGAEIFMRNGAAAASLLPA